MINSVVVIICDLHLVNLVKYRWSGQSSAGVQEAAGKQEGGEAAKVGYKQKFIFEVVIFTSFCPLAF